MRSRWTARSQDRTDVIIAVLLAAAGVAEALTTSVVGPRAIVAAAYGIAGLALAWRRRHPTAVLLVVLAVLGVTFAIVGTSEGIASLAPVFLALYSVGAHCERRVAARGVVAFGAFWALYELRDPQNGDLHDAIGSWPVFTLGVLVWLCGAYVRARRLYVSEHRRAAAAQERTRIARELHDVVAHAMSVMVIQAEAADEVLTRDADRAHAALEQIQRTGRDGLAEMRRLLGVLRQEGAPAFEPQPGVGALRPLVDKVSATGLTVALSISGERRAVSQGVDVSAYRIVQEALTNVMKHAVASSASVSVHYGDQLELEVRDDGRGRSDPGLDGNGLLGMRERVGLYGGTLDAGPAAGGGFRVHATLPIEGQA